MANRLGIASALQFLQVGIALEPLGDCCPAFCWNFIHGKTVQVQNMCKYSPGHDTCGLCRVRGLCGWEAHSRLIRHVCGSTSAILSTADMSLPSLVRLLPRMLCAGKGHVNGP